MSTRRRSRRPAKPRARRTRQSKRGLVIGIALGAGVLLLPLLALFGWALLPGAGSGKRFVVEWPRDADASGAGERLARAGLVSSPRLFA